MFLKKHWWAILYSIALISFTVYVALDTFVITRVYVTVDQGSTGSNNGDTGNGSSVTNNSNSDTDNYESSSESPGDDSDIGKKTDDAAENSGDNGTGSISDDGNANESESNAENESSDASSDSESSGTSGEVILTENSYSDDNITITITEYREYDTAIYVADIMLSSAEYLQSAFANSAYGRNVTEKTSEIAESVNAILAINGDYYGAQEIGYVIRNGILYRSDGSSDQEDLVIYGDGSFAIISESDVTAEALLADGARQVLSFGPALIIDSSISVSEGDEVGKAKTSNPRTAIGITDDLHYVFVVSDGRTEESEGLSLFELAEFMSGLGATNAYNLDGGGSSTMYFNGEIINNPTSDGKRIKERSVSDIVYIGY